MNIIHFIYSCEFTYLGDGEIELDNDQCITSCPEYPADEESGQFGSCFQSLLDQFKEMTPVDGSSFIGLMAGSFVFSQSYEGEHDMDMEVAMSTITPVTKELHDNVGPVTVQLDG